MLEHPGWSFSLYLVIPFLVAMICSTVKSVGDLTTCQKINDMEWKRPDMARILEQKGEQLRFSGFLMRKYSNNITGSTKSGLTHIHMHFDH